MLAVARALMVEPKVLMLDEASAGLSPRLVEMVFAKVKEIRRAGMTILLVEQNVRAALAISDRAYVLVEGQNRHEGRAADLCERRRRSAGSISAAAVARRRGSSPMNLQFIADGLLIGGMIGLGAIGVTLTYSILRFANFAHGEFIAWGAYAALALAGGDRRRSPDTTCRSARSPSAGRCSSRASLAMVLTGLLALALDALLFKRLRRHGTAITLVIASFGAAMALRSLLEFVFSAQPAYFSRAIQFAIPLGLGIRVTPDQLAMLALTALLVVAHAPRHDPHRHRPRHARRLGEPGACGSRRHRRRPRSSARPG